MTIVDLLVGLGSGHPQFVDVDHDDEVARIDMRSKFRLVLAAQAARNFGSQPAQDFVRRIDDKPVMVDFVRLRGKGSHVMSQFVFVRQYRGKDLTENREF